MNRQFQTCEKQKNNTRRLLDRYGNLVYYWPSPILPIHSLRNGYLARLSLREAVIHLKSIPSRA